MFQIVIRSRGSSNPSGSCGHEEIPLVKKLENSDYRPWLAIILDTDASEIHRSSLDANIALEDHA